jgi:hypothetical protein
MNQRMILTGICTRLTAMFAATAQHTQHGHRQLSVDLRKESSDYTSTLISYADELKKIRTKI